MPMGAFSSLSPVMIRGQLGRSIWIDVDTRKVLDHVTIDPTTGLRTSGPEKDSLF
ncbi:hypothetical protein [Polycladomyces subterraneus]|uniref:hypothetical protein n=1 Tax=Polycladomyces subterraneus TaxID=1016997 RepID=UPI00263BC14A|nr:hypothetical protein [Polycladomyces subterraneus]